MRNRWVIVGLAIVVLALVAPAAGAQARKEQGRSGFQPGGARIYGQELMTHQERDSYRQQFWEQKTEREREAYRQRHRQTMQERARNLGVPVFDEGIAPVQKEEKPAKRRAGDGLRRWPDDSPGGERVRRLEQSPASTAPLPRWPEQGPKNDWRQAGRAGGRGNADLAPESSLRLPGPARRPAGGRRGTD